MLQKINYQLLFVLFFSFQNQLLAVEKTEIKNSNSLWFSDFINWKMNKKWSLYMDIGLRGNKWTKEWSQQLVRAGAFYQITNTASTGVGVAYFNHFNKNSIKTEYRTWQQFMHSQNTGRVKINNRIRTEQRFIQKNPADKFSVVSSFVSRIRYQLALQVPLNKKRIENQTVYASVSDEIMFNFGKEIVYNNFDQNRIAIGIGYKQNELLNVLVSYTKIIIQKNRPDSFENTNVFVLSFFHNFKNN